jgi:hypothetical protein
MQIFKVFNPGNNKKNADLNLAKYPSLAKNPPKYTTAYKVQQRNCRWHCEPTFFIGRASTMIIYSHTLPLKSLHLLSLPLQSFPLQTLRLVFFGQFDYLKIKNISHNGLQKSGTKSTEVLLFVPLRRFYTVLFIPLFCRLRDIVKNT